MRVGDDEVQAGKVMLATGSIKKPIPGTSSAAASSARRRRGRWRAAGVARGRRRRRVGVGDRVGVRAARHRGAPLRGARPRPADRGSGHLQARRARAEEAGHEGPHEDARRERRGKDTSVTFTAGGDDLEVEWLVIAAGRGPDVEGLGLEDAGVKLDDTGLIAVDGALRTSAANVYAIGDLVAGPALAHKASDEGIIALEDAAGHATHPLTHVDIPRATFCSPNVGSFGLTEQQARDAGHDVVVGKLQYGAVGAGTVYGDRTGLMKIVGDKKYGELLGGHIVGTRATELIQELVNVRELEGGYPEVARIVHGHPTLSEAVMEAARDADGWLIHGITAGPSTSISARRTPTWRPSGCCTSSSSRASGFPSALPFEPAFRCAEEDAAYREDVERQAAAQGLQPVRWPDAFPFDSAFAQRAATFAKGSGKTVAFALAAFRQAFAGGRTSGSRRTSSSPRRRARCTRARCSSAPAPPAPAAGSRRPPPSRASAG